MVEEPKVFTLEEANAVIPEVVEITDTVVAALRALEFPWARLRLTKYSPVMRATEADIVRSRWAQQIAALGIYPKGFFTVDLQSEDPDLFYCWTFGETAITHCHKTWETFVDRKRLDEVIDSDS